MFHFRSFLETYKVKVEEVRIFALVDSPSQDSHVPVDSWQHRTIDCVLQPKIWFNVFLQTELKTENLFYVALKSLINFHPKHGIFHVNKVAFRNKTLRITQKKRGAKTPPQRHRFCPQNRLLCGTILAPLFSKWSHFSWRKGWQLGKNWPSLQRAPHGSSEAPFWLTFFLSDAL